MRRGIGLHVLVPLALIGAATLVITTALTAFATGQMIEDARALDLAQAAERVRSTELTAGQGLRAVANDYAHWNDMAEFVAAPSDTFRVDNFAADTLDSLDADALLVADAQGKVLVAGMTESALRRWSPGATAAPAFEGAEPLLTIPEPLLRLLLDNRPVQQARSTESSVLGWVPSERGWFQLGASAIGRFGASERRDGLVVFARLLDEERIAERHRLAQARYALTALEGSPGAGAGGIDIVLADPEHGPQARAVGAHAFSLAPTLERFRWFATAQQAVFLVIALLGIAVVVERRVVRRVEALRRGVEQLRDGGREALHLPRPDDELTALGREFARLYASLEQTQRAWRGAALTDALTQRPNRSALIRDLGDTAWLERGPAALLFIDLDGFKQVNDQFGHAVGDECLRRVADAMVDAAGRHSRLYRLGGDEFAVLASAEAGRLGERLVRAVASVAATDATRFGRIGASVGWAPIDADTGVSDALASADLAMYEAKREGGGCVIAFSDDMRARRHERLSLEDRLRDAVDAGAIRAVFQPVADANSGALYAVEALARWRDEERGDVPPSRFIELAEAVGLVTRIDLAVLAQGLACLHALATVAPDCRLQVNLSPRSIDRAGIVDAILEACRAARIPPARVTIEVTESAFASEAATPLLVLSSLRSHGFGIALDDFGVGHSSLSRLARFAPDTLKIDGQFVRDLDGPGGLIVATVVALARQFRIRTTAEFVETDVQWRRLAEQGCDSVQGYGVGIPMAEAELIAWLRTRASAQASSFSSGIGSAMP